MLLLFCSNLTSQSSKAADQVIEGGKVVVELIKAFGNKKEVDKDGGCKGRYADLCVVNESSGSLTVSLHHLSSIEPQRELVILPGMKECGLQLSTGVWTYDLKVTATALSIRKGDLLVEGCQNLMMNIKY
jgi:hypothetical protein